MSVNMPSVYATISFASEAESVPKSSNNISLKSFHDKYYVLDNEILGQGTSSVVKKCINRRTRKEYAVKIIKKAQLDEKDIHNIKREVSALHKLKNTRLTIEFLDYFENDRNIYIVLQLCKGKDLYEWVVDHTDEENNCYHFSEAKIAFIFYQIVRSVHLCHKKGIIHRDIKPDNILFVNNNTLDIVLTDFGLSYHSNGEKSNKMKTKCGSPNYIAPEIIVNKTYNSKVDWWACGVLLYVLLSGSYPFCHKNIKQLYTKIVKGQYSYKAHGWKRVSNEAKDLINKLLTADLTKRYSYKSILSHPFMQMYLITKSTN